MRRGLVVTFVTASSLLLAAACEERFPAPLGAGGTPSAPGVVVDADADASDAQALDAGADASVTASPVDASGGACNARVEAPPVADSAHVADGTPITYATNPPSSGPHYGVWANFQEFDRPVADGYLVHALEHGAVLLLYKCDDDAGACAELVARLRAVRAAVPTDPLCSDGIRSRVILAPRPENAAPVAAAAWGHTYQADCVDDTTLLAFVNAHYAKAPENFCFPGSIF